MIKYELPDHWILYDKVAIVNELAEAKGAVMSLKSLPFQRRWVESLQEIQLKIEVAGTSKIEGADFSGDELEVALRKTPKQLATRSQRQARAAVEAYQWIAQLASDQPMNKALVCEVHKRIVFGADDDHCPPGVVRGRDQNVTFGTPPHRGCEGGEKCSEAFDLLIKAVQQEYPAHDELIQALAFHYQFAAMHPFLDGNGRTARALEALMLQRAGLRDAMFIAMSNYYYDEKRTYLATLGEVRAQGHDLTSFFKFGLKGIALQSSRLAREIRGHISRELYRNLAHDLFTRLVSTRKRVIAERQLEILEILLRDVRIEFERLIKITSGSYKSVKNPRKAITRDLNHLADLAAIVISLDDKKQYQIELNLEWPSIITESEFFRKIEALPTSKTHSFLSQKVEAAQKKESGS